MHISVHPDRLAEAGGSRSGDKVDEDPNYTAEAGQSHHASYMPMNHADRESMCWSY